MAAFTRGMSDSIGDLPEHVVETLKGLDIDWTDDPGTLPELDDQFTEPLQGSDHVTHEGLIDMAHRDGLALTFTEPVSMPEEATKDDPIVFRAIVATNRGVFTAYGDSYSGDTQVSAIVRMAETRALSRALRQAVNVGAATAPEMPDSTDGVQVE